MKSMKKTLVEVNNKVSGYLKALHDTYIKAEGLGLVDEYNEKGIGLRPIYHTSKRATKSSKVVEVTLNKDGEFITATELMEDDYVTYPTTLSSMTRTSAVAPHGLSENINYLTSNYKDKNYWAYLRQLQQWEQSEFSTDIVKAVYNYILEDTIEEDINNLGIKTKSNTFTTFTLLTEDGEVISANEDKETHNEWIEYMRTTLAEEIEDEDKDYSDLTGQLVYVPDNYKGTLGSSKIISVSNKDEPYVGRFPKNKKGEVNPTYKLGLEESLKIFNLIDYLIMNKDTRTYLKMGNPILMWTDNMQGVKKPDTKIEEEDDLLSLFKEVEEKVDLSTLDTTNILAEMRRKQTGISYNEIENVYLLEIDKVSTGRISVKNFVTFKQDDYERRLGYWYETTSWEWGYGKTKTSLSIKDLILRLVGIEQEDKGKHVLKVNGESSEAHVDRLVNDLVRSKIFLQRLPLNLYKKAMTNARNRHKYKNTWQRELQAIMSIYKKYKWDYHKEEVREVKNDTREVSDSYRVGQLLAVYERIEEYANYIKGNQRVETQVSKLWNTATQRPLYALTKIKQQTIPSVNVLKNSNKLFDFETRITEYMADLADSETFKPNRSLEDDFILGYYHEKREMYQRVRTKETTEE